jgi:hypothetical protein
MEFDFTASLNETRDIDLYGFSKKVDKNFDYINDIQIDIKWRAVMYMKDYGITDNWPIIDKISLDMDYQLLEDENAEDINTEEKKYELVLDNTKAVDDFLIEPLGASEKRERTKLKSEDKKWVVESSYSMRDESDTTLFITSIDIDFETKHIIVEF